MSEMIDLGTDISTGETVQLPRKRFGHMHIRGMTGEGKTSLGMIPLTDQFARPYRENGTAMLDPIFIIDFGGDQNYFWTACDIARKYRRTFRYLTLDPELASASLPPIQAVPPGEKNVIRISQMLIRSFHMEHGLVYAGNYFSQQNLAALLRVARTLIRKNGHATLEDINRYLDDPANRREFKDADQVRMCFDFLLEYSQLREALDPEENIDIDRAIENGELIYFYCPTLEEPLTAPLVGGLALYTIISIAIRRKKHGRPLRRTRIFIDEFQEIISRAAAALLAQSRKFGISLFLANQSTTQLQNRDLSLADQIFEGTTVKQYYTCVGDDDIKTLQSLSKDKIRAIENRSTSGFLRTTLGSTDQIVPALERDTILECSAVFGESFLVIKDGLGHRDPIRVRQTHNCKDQSEKPMRRRSDSVKPQTPTPAVPATTEERRCRHAELQALIDKIAAELRLPGAAAGNGGG